MRTDFDAELVQQHLAYRAAGHPGHRFPGARALQDVARVLAVVLERAREVRVAGPRTRHLAAPLAPRSVRFGGHHVLPVLPIAVPHEHRDGGAERLTGAHAREPLDLVGFDLHPSAAAVAAHAPLQLGVDALGRDGQPGGDPLEDRHEPAPVRFARRREAERHVDPRLKPRLRTAAEAAASAHRRGGAGFGFVSVGSRTITRPLAVIPNSSWPVASRATRNGPMIGSRIGMVTGTPAFKSWPPSNVSNTSIFASGRAANNSRLSLLVPLPQFGIQVPPGEKSWK